MKDAAIYLRVSTDQQDYKRQRDELMDYCKNNHLQVKYIFEEKESGRRDDRPEFQKLCALTKEDIQVVVVWEISRLSRKAYMILKVAEDFAQKGICIYAKKENLKTLEDDGSWNSTAKLVLGLFASMAQTELETLRDRVMSGKRNKILSGELDYTFKAPYGYSRVNGKLVIKEDEAEQVRRMFELFAYGHKSTRQIAQSYGWTQTRVSYMLKNPVYMGEVRSGYVPNYVLHLPAIISKELFLMTQDLLKSRRGNQLTPDQMYDNRLRGKIYCGICGSKMYYSRDKKVSIYTCKTNTHKERYMYCSTRIAKHKVDEVLDILLRRRLAENNADENRENLVRELQVKNQVIEKINEQKKTIQDRIDLMEKKIRTLADVGLDVKDEQCIRQKLSKELDSLEESKSREMQDIETLSRSLNDIENMSYEQIDNDSVLKDRVIGDMVEKITVYYLTSGHYLQIRLVGDDLVYGCYIKKQKLYKGENTQIEYITVEGSVIEGEMIWLNEEMEYDSKEKVFRYADGSLVDVRHRYVVYTIFEKYCGIGIERLDIDIVTSLKK